MSSFALEAREECTGHENPWFLEQRRAQGLGLGLGLGLFEELLDGSLLRCDFAQVRTLLSSFFRFWTSLIEIEVLNEEDCSLLRMLYC